MAEKEKRLSLADLEGMQDEALVGFDAEADANAQLAPVPAGKYLVTIKLQENPEGEWESKKSEKKGVPYYSTTIVATVAENPLNPKETHGRKMIFNNIMTMVMEQTGTTGVQAVLQGLEMGKELANGPQTGSRQAAILTKALKAEPLVGCEVDWEASFYGEDPNDNNKKKDLYKRVRGMRNFPKNEKGETLSKMLSPDGLMESDARIFLRRWIPVKALEAEIAKKKGTQGDEAPINDNAGTGEVTAPTPISAKSAAPRPGGVKRTA